MHWYCLPRHKIPFNSRKEGSKMRRVIWATCVG
jgi:hypothetical protein